MSRVLEPDIRSVSTLLLCELSIDGPFYLTGLLHYRRAHTGRCFLESG